MNVRPIWVSDSQREALARCDEGAPYQQPLRDVIDAWDAAPATRRDAIERVRGVLNTQGDYSSITDIARAVLVALGYPGVDS